LLFIFTPLKSVSADIYILIYFLFIY